MWNPVPAEAVTPAEAVAEVLPAVAEVLPVEAADTVSDPLRI